MIRGGFSVREINGNRGNGDLNGRNGNVGNGNVSRGNGSLNGRSGNVGNGRSMGREPIRRITREEEERLYHSRTDVREVSSNNYRNSVGGSRNNRRVKKRGSGGRFLLVSLFVLAVLIGGGIGKIRYTMDQTLNNLNRQEGIDLSNVEVGDLEKSDKIINILLVGSDERKSWNEPGRSDSVMILTLDLKHRQVKLASLMRDMYLNIPGYGEDRFNAAFSYGGIELLYRTIAENFGISVQGYAVVDFSTFMDAVNKIGGVEITLTPEEYEYLIGAYPTKKTIQKLKNGKNNMNGYQALAYCRIRQDAKGDFGRTQRQRNVLSSMFSKVKTMSLGEIRELAEVVLPGITTDLSNEEIISYIEKVLMMGTIKINQFRIPVDNAYTPQRIYGMEVLVVDLEENRNRLHEFIEEEYTGDIMEGTNN